jgi:hypothetical protein
LSLLGSFLNKDSSIISDIATLRKKQDEWDAAQAELRGRVDQFMSAFFAQIDTFITAAQEAGLRGMTPLRTTTAPSGAIENHLCLFDMDLLFMLTPVPAKDATHSMLSFQLLIFPDYDAPEAEHTWRTVALLGAPAYRAEFRQPDHESEDAFKLIHVNDLDAMGGRQFAAWLVAHLSLFENIWTNDLQKSPMRTNTRATSRTIGFRS